MAIKDDALGALLTKQNYLSEEELKSAQKRADELKVPLLSVLIDQGLLTQQLYENALAEYYKLEFYDVQSNPPPANVILEVEPNIRTLFEL